MQITVQIKSVYGVEKIYPVCAKAKAFATLVKQKTLTVDDLRVIKALGYKIEVVQQVLEIAPCN